MSWSDFDNTPSGVMLPGVFNNHLTVVRSHISNATGIEAIELIQQFEDHIIQLQQLRDRLVKNITNTRGAERL